MGWYVDIFLFEKLPTFEIFHEAHIHRGQLKWKKSIDDEAVMNQQWY